jgi:hypothetical protein
MQGMEQVVHEERQPVPAWAGAIVAVASLGGIGAAVVAMAAKPETRLVGFIAGASLLLTDGVILLPMMAGLRVRVTTSTVRVALGIFGSRWSLADVTSCQAVTYDPLRQVGGWGMKYSTRLRLRAFTSRGNRGVLLTLTSGKRVLIGSDEPEVLCSALGTVGVSVGETLAELT